MGTFVYEAIREPGVLIRGETEAEDGHSAAAALLARGYHVLAIEDVHAAGGTRLRPRLGLWGGLTRRELVQLTRDMANLLKAGLPLAQAVRTLAERRGRSGWRAVMGGVRARIEDGQTLSQALGAYPEIYDPLYVNLVRAGEESGRLAEALLRLAEVGEKRNEIKARVKLAMVYPAVMLLVGTATVVVMMAFVVPMFTKVFEEAGQVLPLPTRILVGLSGFCSRWWWALLVIVSALGLFCTRFARSELGRQLVGRLLLVTPLLARVVRKTELAGFAQTLGTLLGNGIGIVRALEVTAATLGNAFYRDAVRTIGLSVRDGALLSRAMETCPLFPGMMANVVAVGEQSGDLAAVLEQVAQENERDVEREVKVVMTLLEPIMIVLLGSVVGFIVLAMLLPIFSLGETIQL